MKHLISRSLALFLAVLMLIGVLPVSSAAASYYAIIDGEYVSTLEHTIYGTENRIWLSDLDLKVTVGSDYARYYSFYETDGRRYQYINEDSYNNYAIGNGESVYLALFLSRDDYNTGNYDKLICITYSTDEFHIEVNAGSSYVFDLSDFDPRDQYRLLRSANSTPNLDGSLTVLALPESGTLYYDKEPVKRNQKLSLYGIQRGLLTYAAPTGVSADTLTFSASNAGGVVLISESTLSIDIGVTSASGLPTSAAVKLPLKDDGSHTFSLDDFDYSGRNYSIEDCTFVRITSLPDYGYIEYSGSAIRTSSWISLADVKAGKLVYTLDNETEFSSVTEDSLTYVAYTANQNGVYTGVISMDLSSFSAAGYQYIVKTDAKGTRTFRISDFDDPDGEYKASDYVSTNINRDGSLLVSVLPKYGSLQLDGKDISSKTEISLYDISSSLLTYVPDSASDYRADTFSFLLFDSTGSRLARSEMYIDRTAVKTGDLNPYGENALVAWLETERSYTFALSDFNAPDGSYKLEDYMGTRSDGYLLIESLPDEGTLYLGRSQIAAGDEISLGDIDAGDLSYTRVRSPEESCDSFTFTAYQANGTRIFRGIATMNIDFFEDKPAASSTYTTTLDKANRVLRVTFTNPALSADQLTASANLTSSDLTDLVAAAGFVGGTLELVADVKDASLSARTITLSPAFFTDNTKTSVFTSIRLVTSDIGSQGTSNICKLQFATADVAALYSLSNADFTLSLEKYSMTTLDKTPLPNATYNRGMARVATFKIGNTLINLDSARLTLPYGTLNSKAETVVMMQRQSGGSFGPALSSTYDRATATVTAWCESGQPCTPYYRGADSGMSFTDLGNAAWATEYIYFLAARNVVNGIGNNQFNPTGAVTNAEFIKMLVASLGLYDANATCSFTDIKGTNSAWAYTYVASAVKAGIVPDGTTFNPAQPISRQMMALYAYRASLERAANIKLPTTHPAEVFLDSAQISSTCSTAVTAMQTAGIIQGDGAGHFDPTGTTTRAAASKIICMLIQMKFN